MGCSEWQVHTDRCVPVLFCGFIWIMCYNWNVTERQIGICGGVLMEIVAFQSDMQQSVDFFLKNALLPYAYHIRQ